MTGGGSRPSLDERFAGDRLNESVWFPYYLPHWSSRAATAAGYTVENGELRLTIGPGHPLWCPDRHAEPLRANVVQTGSFAGPVGSSIGQQPFTSGLTVLEAQPEFRGFTPRYGRIGVEMRAEITERSMFALWLSGFEDQPERSGEICVAEIFGDAVRDGVAEVGVGVKAFRDPALTQEFGTVPLALDITQLHRYEVEWAPGSLTFSVDDEPIRRLEQAPDYPVQLMLGLFDFPAKAATSSDPVPTAELVVSRVWGTPLVPTP